MAKTKYAAQVVLLDGTKKYVKVGEHGEMKLVRNKANADLVENRNLAELLSYRHWEHNANVGRAIKGLPTWRELGFDHRGVIEVKSRSSE